MNPVNVEPRDQAGIASQRGNPPSAVGPAELPCDGEASYRQLFEANPHPMWFFDPENRYQLPA